MDHTFLILAPRSKIHICENRVVADAVFRDLQFRTSDVTMRDRESDQIHIDFGGSIKQGTEVIEVPGSNVAFFAMHFDFVYHRFRTAPLRDGLYHKIHGHLHCFCLSKETFQSVWTFIATNKSDLLERQATAIALSNIGKS